MKAKALETYYRVNRTVYATAPDFTRDIAVVTCDTLLGAGLTIRQLIITDGGRLGDWRKYVNRRKQFRGDT
tara:strand:+ start:218 stop:430 length:213 start_codon:yes stop_codon:yes gene_type:complete